MANKIILIGNLTKDPETRTMQDNLRLTRFQIAVNPDYKDANGNKGTDFFDIVTWRALAENCAKFLHKGSRVFVEGAMHQRQYQDKSGAKKRSYQVTAERIEFLSPRDVNVYIPTLEQEQYDNDIQADVPDEPDEPDELPF